MNERFQILSLDGGGLKGLFSAAVLECLEQDLGSPIAEHFDLIVGTSTGGIIALALGAGLSPKDVVEFYLAKGSRIFPSPGRRWLRQLVRSKYEPDELQAALRECLGDRLLGDSKKRLVVPAYNIDEDDIYLFKTPHHEDLRRDWSVPMWQVALATSAAPTFLPVCRQVYYQRLIDGGVWANNPIMLGVVEAITKLDVQRDSIRFLSLGTTDPLVGRPAALNRGGLAQWARSILEILMRGQSIGAYNQAMQLVPHGAAFRLDPRVPPGLFALDRPSRDELRARAAFHSRKFRPIFERRFADHQAAEFKPLYS